MVLKGAIVNFLGDSITEGAGASKPGNGYVEVIGRKYRLKAANNYGIGGTRIARQQIITDSPYDRDFCMRVEEMDRNADAVVVFGGSNDYGHGQAPIGMPEDRTPDTFYGACNYLMGRLLTLYCGKPILIVTPLRRIHEDNPRGEDDGRKKYSVAPLSVYRRILMEVAALYALPVLDLYATSGIVPEHPECSKRLLVDGLHPSDEGHAIIARRIANALMLL